MANNAIHCWQPRLYSLARLIALLLGTHLAQGQAPTITGLSPARNQRSAPATSPVAITFSQAMQNSAATQQAVRVFSQQRGGLMFGANRGSTTVSGSTVSFDPATDFQPGETVYVTTTTAATAANGTPLPQGHVYQFTAAVAPTGAGQFQGTQNVSAGFGVIKVADVDSDGDPDLLSFSLNAVEIRYNDGAGSFNGTYKVPLGSSPGDLAVGDVDGDGDLDLVTANPYAGTVSVCLNNGNGTFGGNQDLAIAATPSGVALGDVDADGDLDLVTANPNPGTVSVRLNNGSGVFSGTQTVSTGSISGLIKLADWDADGDLDLTVAAPTASSVSVWSNDGTGTFTGPSNQFNLAWYPSDVAIGDLDADGDLDFVVPNDPAFSGRNTLSVQLNAGGGFFQAAPNVDIVRRANGLTLGDVDGDGDLDLFAFGDTVSVRLNDGAGQFSGGFEISIGAPSAYDVRLGDVDGDGDLDLLARTAKGVSVRLHTPAATMAITSVAPARNQCSAPRAASVTVTFDQPLQNTPATRQALRVFSHQRGGLMYGTRDGTAAASGNTLTFDPVIGFRPGETVAVTTTIGVAANGYALPGGQVYQFTAAVGGTGQGNTWSPPSLPTIVVANSTESVATGDIDGDGDLDFVASGVWVSVRHNNGFGMFSGTQNVNINNRAKDVALADVDGDGDLDVVTSNLGSSGNRVSILLNDGTGTFTIGSHVAVNDLPDKLGIGDLDADGDLDLVCATDLSTVSVRLNGGNGVFTGTQEVSVGSCQRLVTLGDVDGDGDLDIVAPNVTSGTVSVRPNDGKGTFGGGYAVALGVTTRIVALGDVDADGDLDLLALGGSTGRLLILRNDGTGVFSPYQDLAISIAANSIKLGDVDADGDLDVLLPVTNNFTPSAGSVSGFRNDGMGVFSTSFSTRFSAGTATNPVALALGDLDGDGDLDLLSANNASSGPSNTVSVRLNDGTGPQVGLPADAASAALTLAPNPVPAGASLRLTGLKAATVVALLDATGRQLGILQADATGAATLPAARLRPGLYLLCAADGRTRRLVVE